MSNSVPSTYSSICLALFCCSLTAFSVCCMPTGTRALPAMILAFCAYLLLVVYLVLLVLFVLFVPADLKDFASYSWKN